MSVDTQLFPALTRQAQKKWGASAEVICYKHHDGTKSGIILRRPGQGTVLLGYEYREAQKSMKVLVA